MKIHELQAVIEAILFASGEPLPIEKIAEALEIDVAAARQLLENLAERMKEEDRGIELVELDGENDHVHLLVTYPPKVSVAKLVNSLKGVSSRMIRRMGHESIQNQLWKGALWSPSYFAASCGGAPLSIIKQYIEQQNTPQ